MINFIIFKDILIESDVIGQEQIKGAMTGKHYNRSMHCHKVMSEALQRLRFQAFMDSLCNEDSTKITAVVCHLFEDFPSEHFEAKVRMEAFSEVLTMYEQFVVRESEKSPTFSLWSSYLEMIDTLLQFVR